MSARFSSVVRTALVALVVLAGLTALQARQPADAATGNLVQNNAVEQLDGIGKPVGWTDRSYGANTRTLGVSAPGRLGTGHALSVSVTAFTDGAAYYSSASFPVTPGKLYTISDWYRSTVPSEINAKVTRSTGAASYHLVATVPASADWSQAAGSFTAPAGALSVQIYHLIKSAGTLVTDDYGAYTDTGLDLGMVSVTFDDGWLPQYEVARPILAANGIPGTFYIVSGELQNPERMTAQQVLQMRADGHEIGAHSISHPYLTALGPADVDLQLARSQRDLEALLGAPVRNFAYPFGSANPAVQAACLTYYRTCRGTTWGYNTVGYDPGAVIVQYIHPTTTIAQFRSWVDTARATRTWLVLVYHSFEANPQKVDDTTPQAFADQMAYLRSSGVPTRSVDDAVTLLAQDPDTAAPRTAVTGPTNGGTVSAGTVTVTASAGDDHAVTAVDLLVDGVPVQTDGTAPYAFGWTATPGTHTVQTRAHDAAGHAGTSPLVTVDALTELAAETWSGTAWPANWSTEVSNGHVDVSASAGRLAFDDVRYAFADADLDGAAGTDTDLVLSYRFGQTTGGGWFTVFLRGSGGWQDGFRPRTGYGVELSSGSGTVTVEKSVNGTVTYLRTVTGARPLTTGKQWLRVRITGDQLRFRVWPDGTAEPATWSATVTDGAVNGSGALYLGFARSSTNTGAKDVTVDDLVLRAAA